MNVVEVRWLSELPLDALLHVVRHLMLRAALSLSCSSRDLAAILREHGLGCIAGVPRLLTSTDNWVNCIGYWSAGSANHLSLSAATPHAIVTWRKNQQTSGKGYNLVRQVSQAHSAVLQLSRAVQSPLGRMTGLTIHTVTAKSKIDYSDMPKGCMRVDWMPSEEYAHDLVRSWEADPGLWTALQCLNLSSWQSLTGTALHALFAALPSVPSLHELNLCDVGGGGNHRSLNSACASLATSLRTMHHLAVLNLGCCGLDDAGVRAVARSIEAGPGLGALEVLGICGGGFGPRSAELLIEALAERALPRFRYLDLENWEGLTDGVDDACGRALENLLECGGLSPNDEYIGYIGVGGHQLTAGCRVQLRETAAAHGEVRVSYGLGGASDEEDEEPWEDEEDDDDGW